MDNKKLATATLFIDLKKAFDTIDHNILISKLEHYGFRGKFLNLCSSFLKHRKCRTLVNGLLSNESEINIGVPQGSVLGPLFFYYFSTILLMYIYLH